MNPLPLAMFLSAVLSSLATWFVTDIVKEAELARLQRTQVQQQLVTANAALAKLDAAATLIHQRAAQAQADLGSVNARLSLLQKKLPNAKATPLAADCVPGSGRMSILTDAVDTVNDAAAGFHAGRALPPAQ